MERGVFSFARGRARVAEGRWWVGGVLQPERGRSREAAGGSRAAREGLVGPAGLYLLAARAEVGAIRGLGL